MARTATRKARATPQGKPARPGANEAAIRAASDFLASRRQSPPDDPRAAAFLRAKAAQVLSAAESAGVVPTVTAAELQAAARAARRQSAPGLAGTGATHAAAAALALDRHSGLRHPLARTADETRDSTLASLAIAAAHAMKGGPLADPAELYDRYARAVASANLNFATVYAFAAAQHFLINAASHTAQTERRRLLRAVAGLAADGCPRNEDEQRAASLILGGRPRRTVLTELAQRFVATVCRVASTLLRNAANMATYGAAATSTIAPLLRVKDPTFGAQAIVAAGGFAAASAALGLQRVSLWAEQAADTQAIQRFARNGAEVVADDPAFQPGSTPALG